MRKIIHIDADCFYAAVEMQENPNLLGVPIAVGGSADRRGVIATCNYEARRFGVKSAMSTAYALRLCPGLKMIPPQMALYREYSRVMKGIFLCFTDRVEPLSLDEAYLDVSECDDFQGSATLIAQEIRCRVHEELGITVSAGVAPVKFLAKVASDINKPDGIFVVPPEKVSSFVSTLPVTKIPGVGPVTAKKLARFGIHTCQELKDFGLSELVRVFGSFGSTLFERSQGIDDRNVEPHRDRKSISVEHTYSEDISGPEKLLAHLQSILEELCVRVNKAGAEKHIRTVFVKLKFNDFTVTTIETSKGGITLLENITLCQRLLNAAWQRKRLPVRLLGLGVRLREDAPSQLLLPFDEDSPPDEEQL